eukprot:2552698-Prymnesium_polylepis.1
MPARPAKLIWSVPARATGRCMPEWSTRVPCKLHATDPCARLQSACASKQAFTAALPMHPTLPNPELARENRIRASSAATCDE